MQGERKRIAVASYSKERAEALARRYETAIIDDPIEPKPEPDETARERVALLARRQELDVNEAKYKKLAAEYGGNRKGRRRARAEVDRDARKKKGRG